MRQLSLPEGSDKEDFWERVIVPSIQMKYVNLKGNMNNDLKIEEDIHEYEHLVSIRTISQKNAFELTKCALVYSSQTFFAGDTKSVNPDVFAFGLKMFMKNDKLMDDEEEPISGGFNEVYEFFTKYVRRIHPDTDIGQDI